MGSGEGELVETVGADRGGVLEHGAELGFDVVYARGGADDRAVERLQRTIESGLGLALHGEAGADDVAVGIDSAAESGQRAAQLAYGGSVVIGGAVGDVYEAAPHS